MRRAALVLGLLLAACSGGGGAGRPESAAPTSTSVTGPSAAAITEALLGGGTKPSTTVVTAPANSAATLLAAGDVASCSSTGDEATAALLDDRPNASVAVLGDAVYEAGTAAEYANCYAPSWGRHKARTRPALGNHDYGVFRAGGYFGEFGAAAGEAPLGWYSYELGDWHVVVLNSNCEVVGCATGGTQEKWLRADLAAHPKICTLAYWHHPRFSSGTTHGSNPAVLPLWTALYEGGADVVLAGHEHNYERFAPLDPTGKPDDVRGIRQFVVGTGGRSHYPFGTPLPGSQVRNDNTYGILALTLRATSYQWQFVPEAGKSFTDAGSTNCH